MPNKKPTSPTNPAHLVDQEYAVVPIGSIKAHPRNVRDSDVGAIGQSVSANGFYGTVVVQKSTSTIIAGKHRWLAAAQNHLAEVPVVFVDVDDATALKILLADNRASELGTDDPNKLADLLADILKDQGDLEGTLFSESDLDELISANNADMADVLDDKKSAKPVQTIVCPCCGETFTVGGDEE